MKMESAKIYDKSNQIQKRQQLTKEGAVSFNYGSRKAKFPNWMKVDERETYLFS